MNADGFLQQADVDRFTRQVEVVHQRLIRLYHEGNSVLPLQNLREVPSRVSSLLPISLKELGVASEELQVAVEELRQQNEELAAARAAIEVERQRYQDLFEFAPDGYLVTDKFGAICFANRTAAALLNIPQERLVGKLLINFVPPEERQSFRAGLTRLHQQIDCLDRMSTADESMFRRHREWEVQLQPRSDKGGSPRKGLEPAAGRPFNAAMTVAAAHQSEGTVTLRWLLRDISERKRAEAMLEKSEADLSRDYPVHPYAKGDSIPLNSQVLWQVNQGLVKLSTFCEAGDEVLVGLAGPSMLFGPSMTSLKTFQATALSEVQLVCLPLSEIAASPHLAQSLLAQVNQRLRQTEALLAVSGERRVENRLHHLLQLLRQEVGQPVKQGTRLSVRLTHEDLANACCTTRVTITRLLSRLQQQGKLTLDAKRHIILSDNGFETICA